MIKVPKWCTIKHTQIHMKFNDSYQFNQRNILHEYRVLVFGAVHKIKTTATTTSSIYIYII